MHSDKVAHPRWHARSPAAAATGRRRRQTAPAWTGPAPARTACPAACPAACNATGRNVILTCIRMILSRVSKTAPAWTIGPAPAEPASPAACPAFCIEKRIGRCHCVDHNFGAVHSADLEGPTPGRTASPAACPAVCNATGRQNLRWKLSFFSAACSVAVTTLRRRHGSSNISPGNKQTSHRVLTVSDTDVRAVEARQHLPAAPAAAARLPPM